MIPKPDIQDNITRKQFLLLMLIAYIFAVGVRFIWIDFIEENPRNFFNNEVMINTNDGYAYAEGARDLLAGFHQEGDKSYVEQATSQVTALLASILPISLETLILYMPGFLGALLVIPMMLLTRALNLTIVGFIAALLGGIAWSYYNRTMFGYYDSDMMTIVLPTISMFALILTTVTQKNRFLILLTMSVLFYMWWYPAGKSLIFAMAITSFVYSLVFDRKNLFNYKIPAFMLLGLLPALPLYVALLIAIALFTFFHIQKEKSNKIVLPLLATIFVAYLTLGGLDSITHTLKAYVFKDAITNLASADSLKYYSVVQTVREASAIPFETFANRISGSQVGFFFSLAGFALLLVHFRVMLLTLPMVGLGFLAYKNGLRFTVYAVPILAIGVAYLIFYISVTTKNRQLSFAIGSILTVALLYPNIIHIMEYKVPTVFTKEEVTTLDKLKKVSSREDYVIAWWDYGFPLRYYGDIKVLSDGAQHSGGRNFSVSQILTNGSSQQENAQLARHVVEADSARNLGKTKHTGEAFEIAMKEAGFTEPYKFLDAIAKNQVALPKKTRDIYFTVPMRMVNIYPTVHLFSNMNIKTGAKKTPPLLYYTQRFNQSKTMINLGGGITVDKTKGELNINGQKTLLHQFIAVHPNSQGKVQISTQNVNAISNYSLVFLAQYNAFLLADNKILNTLYMQLMFFDNYDPSLFELIDNNPLMKVYKLKI
jgi:dolichyl-diphosphooligosaccharide--protein glycosyltransferase/undecaprenyl-diphosphooligosaccharide--protein glycosyltransferase